MKCIESPAGWQVIIMAKPEVPPKNGLFSITGSWLQMVVVALASG